MLSRASRGCERDLGREITTLYAHINVATYHLLCLIGEFDTAGLAAREGCLTTAHWLNYRCGIGLAAAREKVRVAQALTTLPLIAEAFRAGKLSYSKVRALTRAANPANEASLLKIARHATAAQAERILRQYRQTLAREEKSRLGEPARPAAELRCYWNEAGELVLQGRLPAEMGALLEKALERQMDAERMRGSAENTPAAERRAAALMHLAEASLTEPANDAGSSSADRYQVHVELNPRGSHLTDGPGLHEATIKRLTCDASLVAHRTDADGNPLDVGRKTRTVPTALRRALQRRDRGCRFPGCTQHRFVDAHHVRHWADGGATNLDNLVLLCRRHHRSVHEEGFRIEVERPPKGAARFHFYTSSGTYLPPQGERLAGGDVRELSKDASAEASIDPQALTPVQGERRPDYPHINWVLTTFVPRE